METSTCKHCGAALQPGGSLEGICLHCLMQLAVRATAPPGTKSGEPAPPSPDPAEIAPLFPQYEILGLIGRGGMGVVYEAEQISLQRRVALKVLPLVGLLDPRQLARFRTEAQAAAILQHPHIVAAYGIGCERGVHYYAMQYIEGTTLADVTSRFAMERIKQTTAIPIPQP